MTPEGWKDLTLNDIATIVGGGTPTRSEPAYWDGDVPWATPTDVTGLTGRVISETHSTITETGLESSSAALLPSNSLLMTTRATIGACAINHVSMATNQGFQSLVPKRGTDISFLYCLMQHNKRRLERLAAGSTFLEVSKRTVRGFRIVLPPFPEQRKIAAILSSVDDAIEKTQAVIDQVQVVKRGLMQELLTRGLSGRHTRFKQTEIGEIPTEWDVLALGDVTSIGSGTTPSKERDDYWQGGTVAWLPTGKVNDRIVWSASVHVTEKAVRETSLRILPIGTLLIAMIGQGKTRGKTAFLEIEACVNQNFAYVIPRRQISSRFLFYVLEYQYEVLRSAGRGSNQDALNCRIIKGFKVPLPTSEEQSKIATVLGALDVRLELERRRIEFLGNVKHSLMSVLLTGELRVTLDAEPA